MENGLLSKINQIRAIADTGLLYAENMYDRERYQQLKEISLELLSDISHHPLEALHQYFPLLQDYPTAKVDVRGILLAPDKKILLVQEVADGKWSLPGGWADIGFTPKEVIKKEFKEETGLDIQPIKLLAVFDKKKHPHPPQPHAVYKMVFACKALSQKTEPGFDVLDVQFFKLENLPPLSEDRIVKQQIELLHHKILSGDMETYVD